MGGDKPKQVGLLVPAPPNILRQRNRFFVPVPWIVSEHGPCLGLVQSERLGRFAPEFAELGANHVSGSRTRETYLGTKEIRFLLDTDVLWKESRDGTVSSLSLSVLPTTQSLHCSEFNKYKIQFYSLYTVTFLVYKFVIQIFIFYLNSLHI